MVYLPPPQFATPTRPSYAEAYQRILASHRKSPYTSASSVVILVAPDVDALCAARMFADLFKQDDVLHRILPVCNKGELRRIREDLVGYPELHTILMLNMGSTLQFFDWLTELQQDLTVHIIDSYRPVELDNIFGSGDVGDRIVFWDDGHIEDLVETRSAWEALAYGPPVESESDASEDDSDDLDTDEDDEDEDENDSMFPNRKRRARRDDGSPSARKRRKRDTDDSPSRPKSPRMTRDEFEAHNRRRDKHYLSGTHYGQNAAVTVYLLATALERVDNDLLWLAILGLTFQYVTSRISRAQYDRYHSVLYDEVSRLNPINSKLHADDNTIRTTDELRFMLFRHWNLYDAMYHSSYVAGKLGIWKERGRKRLTGLLAKMGFSIPQTQQTYTHMDIDLKDSLINKLETIAPEYGLVELSYPSFQRAFGYKTAPISASDAVEALTGLLAIAHGTRIEVEVEGARHGGEWFGGGRTWQGTSETAAASEAKIQETGHDTQVQNTVDRDVEAEELRWWTQNFWTAYDSLSNVKALRAALPLCMSLQRAIIRQGASIIDKQDIKTMRGYRVVIINQGPDLHLFGHPALLSRLALWLVDALRDRVNSTQVLRKKGLPLVVACLDEKKDAYVVVGVVAALDFDAIKKNNFGRYFLQAKRAANADVLFGSWDVNVVEIAKPDIEKFLEKLSEGGQDT